MEVCNGDNRNDASNCATDEDGLWYNRWSHILPNCHHGPYVHLNSKSYVVLLMKLRYILVIVSFSNYILTVHCVNVLYLNKDNMNTLLVHCVTHNVLYNSNNILKLILHGLSQCKYKILAILNVLFRLFLSNQSNLLSCCTIQSIFDMEIFILLVTVPTFYSAYCRICYRFVTTFLQI